MKFVFVLQLGFCGFAILSGSACRDHSTKQISERYALDIERYTMGDTGSSVSLRGTPPAGKQGFVWPSLHSGFGDRLVLHGNEIIFVGWAPKGSETKTKVLYSNDSIHVYDISQEVAAAALDNNLRFANFKLGKNIEFGGLKQSQEGVEVIFDGTGILGANTDPIAKISWMQAREWALHTK